MSVRNVAMAAATIAIAAGLAFGDIVPARAAAADALTQLRATLHRLDTDAAVRGTFTVKTQGVNGDGDAAKKQAASLRLDVKAGGDLSVHYPAGLLQKVRAERKAHRADASKDMPTAALMGQIGSSAELASLSAARMLLTDLARAESPKVTSVKLDGQPAHELTATIPQSKDAGGGFADAKDFSRQVSVWTDTDGTPLAYSLATHVKFCKFFMCMAIQQSESGRLAVVDGRLVATKRVFKHKQSGFGPDSHSRTTYTLHLQPAAASTDGARADAPAAARF